MSVFVSGASGFIAQHIVKQLIEKDYKVVGTVRSPEKGDALRANFGGNFVYEVVKEIGAENAFDEALKQHPEVTVFLHTASPFHFNVTDVEKDLLIPAVNGTRNALTSIQKYGPQIKKVVVTSSYVAASFDPYHSPLDVIDETSWSGVDHKASLGEPFPFVGYVGSKTLAEQAAWDFVKTEKPNFTFNTVLPSYVFGPQAFESNKIVNTSSLLIKQFIELEPTDDVPDHTGAFVDVRDVAKAHLDAFESDTTNFRYVLVTSRFTGQQIADIINKDFPELKGKAVVGTPGSGQDKIDKLPKVNFSKTIEKIGKGVSLETSIVDTVLQFLKK